MKWLKRTWLSITRRPAKTGMLFLVVFVMMTLLAGSLAVVQTCSTIKQHFKDSISPKVALAYNNYYEKNGTYYHDPLSLEDINHYMDVVKKMSNDENVTQFETSYVLENTYAVLSDMGFENNTTLYFNLHSTNVVEPSEFQSGKLKLNGVQKNRFFSEEELTSNEILIISQFELGVIDDPYSPTGKTRTKICDIGEEVILTIPSPYVVYDAENQIIIRDEYKFKAKVVGVIDSKIVNDWARIYVSEPALMKLVNDANDYFKEKVEEYTDLAPVISSTVFSMDSIDNTKKFVENTNELRNELPERVEWESTSDLYERNVGPVEILGTVAKVILIISIIATILILGLVVIFLISDRKKEMGIYVSLGEKTKYIIGQIVCEVLLVSLLSITLSSVSGIFLGNKLSDYMLEIQRYVQRQQSMGVIANLPVIYKPVEDGLTMNTRDDVIDQFEVQADAEYFVTLYIVGGVSIIVACFIPISYLTSLKPKEIML